MRKIKELEGVISDKLYYEIKGFLNIYANIKFDYLGLEIGSWENLFVLTIEKIIENGKYSADPSEMPKVTGEMIQILNLSVKNYIKKQLKKGNIRIFNNLFIKLRRENRDKRLLRYYVYEFEHLGISFINEVYDLVKEDSLFFKELLKKLGLSTFNKEQFICFLNKEYEFGIKSDSENMSEKSGRKNDIDYNTLMKKYSNLTFEEIKSLYGEEFGNLSSKEQKLLQRYFDSVVVREWLFAYEAEKNVNLILYGYKKKDISINLNKLRQTYLNNKAEFTPMNALYLECFVFGLQPKSLFKEKYPNAKQLHRSDLINRLEAIYYGIENILDYNLTRGQYLEVSCKYPREVENCGKPVLDKYYGVNGRAMSTAELCAEFEEDDESKMLKQISRYKRSCLSLYNNLSKSQNIDKNIYLPYVLNEKYELNEYGRKALKLLLVDNLSYDEIRKAIKKSDVSKLISRCIQKIDEYRFGIDKPKSELIVDENMVVSANDIIEEIERHTTDSVITESDKEFISYLLGIKNEFNPDGEQIGGKKLQEKLNFKKEVQTRKRQVLDKIKQRKLGNLTPDLIFIPREKLSEILTDVHLPITLEDREIICYLLELNGYPLKTSTELAQQFGLSSYKSLLRKYKTAIVNINKYLLGEKEGIINYELDIVPNLRYFPLKERELIYDHYVNNLTNDEIAKKYDLTSGRTESIMYRIKTTLKELISNPRAKKFDYDYYKKVVDKPNFPFRGDLELAKKIFELYVGENTLKRESADSIKQILGISADSATISKIINSLILGVCKYKDGIRKENSFSIGEIKDFYRLNRNSLSKDEIKLFSDFFKSNFLANYRVSEDLVFLMLKNKYPDYYRAKTSKSGTLRILKMYYSVLSKNAKRTLMFYAGITQRDLMNGQEKNHVLKMLASLDRKLNLGENQEAQKRILTHS